MMFTRQNVDEEKEERRGIMPATCLIAPALITTMITVSLLSVARERSGPFLVAAARCESPHTETAIVQIDGNYGIGISGYTMSTVALGFGRGR